MSAMVGTAGTGMTRGDGSNLLPMHLLGSTNEQKMAQVPQQLPLKLATGGYGGSTGGIDETIPGGMGGGRIHHHSGGNCGSTENTPPSTVAGVAGVGRLLHQFFPSLRSPSETVTLPSYYSSVRPAPFQLTNPQMVSAMVGGNKVDATPPSMIDRRPPPHSNSNITVRPTQSFNSPPSALPRCTTEQSASKYSTDIQSNKHRQPTSSSYGNILPMKLAEKPRPRSATVAAASSMNQLTESGTQSADQSPVTSKRGSSPYGCVVEDNGSSTEQLDNAVTTHRDNGVVTGGMTSHSRRNSAAKEQKVVYF